MLHAPQTTAQNSIALRLSRQPVFDAAFEVVGYALLMRGDDGASDARPEAILSSYASQYADRVVGGQKAFVRIGEEQLAQKLEKVLPTSRTILEIANSSQASEQLGEHVKRLNREGYSIALGDFVLTRAVQPLLESAHFVKLDVPRFTNEQLVKQIKFLKQFDVQTIAANIHSHEQFELCQELGFDFFQGTFLCRPRDVKSEAVKVQRNTVMELLAKINDPETGVKELVETIRSDGGLVVRLLRIVNSAFYGMNRRVHTTQQAISLLGLQRIRAWVALLAVADLDDKPDELILTAMVRARMAELLATEIDSDHPECYFIAGILSMLDAMMDVPMKELVDELPLTVELRKALLHRRGDMGRALYCVEAHERAVWGLVNFGGLTSTQIQDCWIESVEWARQMSMAVRT
jgi:EAL and modified HD-GYP domain-containing signal transduction protein